MRTPTPETRAVRYCEVRSGPGDPLDTVSAALRECGVRVTRVARRAGRITGRVDLRDGSAGWRVVVTLYPRPDACFVEIGCEAADAPSDLPGPDEQAVRIKMGLLGSLSGGRDAAGSLLSSAGGRPIEGSR